MLRVWPMLALLATAPAAAGIFGGPPTRIPRPTKPFVATVEDHMGVEVQLGSVTWDGEVHVWGKLGAAEVTVPFENVADLKVAAASDDDHRTVVIQTRHGDEVRLIVEDDVPVYGETAYGNYRIEIADVRAMQIAPAPE